MIRKILHPTDFTPISERASQFAMGLARLSGACITVLHVVEPVILPGTEEDEELTRFSEDLHERASERVQEMVRNLEKEGVTAEGQVLVGHSYETLESFARAARIDLVVMGSHDLAQQERRRIGTLSQKVFFLLSDIPVLFVR